MSSCKALVKFINNTKKGQTHSHKITDTTKDAQNLWNKSHSEGQPLLHCIQPAVVEHVPLYSFIYFNQMFGRHWNKINFFRF